MNDVTDKNMHIPAQTEVDIIRKFMIKTATEVTESENQVPVKKKNEKIVSVAANEEVDLWGVPASKWTTAKINYVDPYCTEVKNYRCACCRVVVGHCRRPRKSDAEKKALVHQCDICGKFYATRKKMTNHKLRHQEKKIACEYCGKKFHTKAECRIHSSRHLSIPDQFWCNFCPRTFSSAPNLSRHLRNIHISGMSCTTCVRVSVIQYTSVKLKNVENKNTAKLSST